MTHNVIRQNVTISFESRKVYIRFERRLRSLRSGLVEGIGDPVPTIVKELGRVAQMLLIVRSLSPLSNFDFICIHGEYYTVVFNRGDSAVRNVTVSRKKKAFVDKKRIFIDLCYVTNVLVICRLDAHTLVDTMLVPVWHR